VADDQGLSRFGSVRGWLNEEVADQCQKHPRCMRHEDHCRGQPSIRAETLECTTAIFGVGHSLPSQALSKLTTRHISPKPVLESSHGNAQRGVTGDPPVYAANWNGL
jgi:hypothetical protein